MQKITCERSLAIWDHRAKQKQSNIVHIKPLEQTVHCMTYVPWKLNGMPDDCILFGDDQGYINVLRLSSKDLHMKNTNTQNDSQAMVIDPAKLTNEIIRRKIHGDWVIKVKYFPQLQLFGSCSQCSVTSFILGDLDKLINHQPLRELSITKGVNCFDYCARANVVATAGADKIIRMWHPLIFTRPTGKLIGHLFTISEVTVNENDQHLISLSTARVFRIWDIQTLTCLQVFTSSDTSPTEKRISAMFYDPKRDRLITGCGTIEMWPLTRAIQDSLQLPHTHDRAVSQLLYNHQMNQVVTVCLEPVLKLWEMETGHLVYQISEPHGPGHEVTAVNVNTTGYRLVTGAYDGSIKVWDFGSGQLHKSYHHSSKDGVKDSTITGLFYFMFGEKQCLMVSSWGHTIRIFEDCVTSDVLVQLTSLSDVYYCHPTLSKGISNDDVFPVRVPLPPIGETVEDANTGVAVNLLSSCQVTCLDYLNPRLLVAGTTNGTLILWDIESQKIIQRFERLESGNANSRRVSKHIHESDYKLVNSCKFVSCQNTNTGRKITSIFETPEEDRVSEKDPDESDSIENKEGSTNFDTKPENVESGKGNTNFTERTEDEIAEDNKNELRETLEDEQTHQRISPSDDFASDFDEIASSNEQNEVLKVSGEGKIRSYQSETEFAQSLHHLGVVSAHHDGYIRFWDFKGALLTEVRMTVNHRSSSVTALSYQSNSNVLVTSDVRGYVMVWDIENFFKHLSNDKDGGVKDCENTVDQLIYWRAHLSKIVALEQVRGCDVLVTASVDSSVRVWHQHTGHFIGFFGQPRLWHIPSSASVPSTPLRPYDIVEVPKKMQRQTTKAVKNKPKTNQSVDCPLTFDDERWKPFRYSAKEETRSTDNKKFFNSLSKPRHYNFHLDSWQSGVYDPGAVFRSLPVYKIHEPERLKTPAVDSSSWLTNPITGTAYTMNKPITNVNSQLPPSVDGFISRFPHAVPHKR